jgi:hypothetical protein
MIGPIALHLYHSEQPFTAEAPIICWESPLGDRRGGQAPEKAG